MDEFLQATILGLATASILAIAASGLVLTYTTTGIFNFAHGALGMLGAFAYWQLRFDWGWPAPIALGVVLGVLAPLVGAAIERVVMRGLYDAPETVRVVVSISLLVALLGLGLWLWSPQEAHPLRALWAGRSFEVLGVTVTWHEATAFLTAVALALGLRLLLYRTRPGVAMRAAVDDRPLSMLHAARPHRSAMLAWAIGCACAALGGILISPITTLGHVNLTLMIVNTYAAAIIGRLRSLPMTFVGAVVLGLADSWAIAYLPDDSVLLSRFRFALPVVVLFVVLLALPPARLRGHGLRRARESIPRPSRGGALLTAAAFVLAGLFLAQILDDADSVSAARIAALAIIGLSLVPLVGFAGQLSLCQMSFAGVGAIVMAHHGQGGDPLALVYAALITGVVGALVAIPALRLGGLYLALATGAFAVFLDQWVFVLEPFDLGPVTIRLFPSGAAHVDRVDLPGAGSAGGMLVLLSVVFALLYLLVVAVRRSNFGRRLLAMKDSPAACATVGMNITATKLAVFTLSAAMAGLGGALYGGTLGSITPDRFSFFESLPLLLLGVVGGIGSAAGALLAGLLLGGIPILVDQWPWFGNISRLLPGTMGIALGRNPNGIAGDLREGFAPLRHQPVVLAATVTGATGVLALRLLDVIAGYPFVVSLGAVVVGGAAAAQYLQGRVPGAAVADRPEPRLEWLGIDAPFTPADVARLDRRLGLEVAER